MGMEWDELEKLPDDVTIEVDDGAGGIRRIKLGEVRDAAKGFVNKRIADLTPREQKLVTREKRLEEQEKQVRETIAALANNPTIPPSTTTPPGTATSVTTTAPLGYTQEQWAAILNDPYSRPLVTTLAAMAERMEALDKQLKERDISDSKRRELETQQRETAWINHQLDQLAKNDARYQDPTVRQNLLEYAKEVLSRRDLTVLDKAMNYDTRMKESEEAGYQRGLKESQSKGPVPSIPHGTRQAPVPPAPEKLPASFNEFADAAANDQSLIQEIREAASVPTASQQ